MLSVEIKLNAIMLNIILPNGIMLNIILPNGIMLNINTLNGIMQNVINAECRQQSLHTECR